MYIQGIQSPFQFTGSIKNVSISLNSIDLIDDFILFIKSQRIAWKHLIPVNNLLPLNDKNSFLACVFLRARILYQTPGKNNTYRIFTNYYAWKKKHTKYWWDISRFVLQYDNCIVFICPLFRIFILYVGYISLLLKSHICILKYHIQKLFQLLTSFKSIFILLIFLTMIYCLVQKV